MGDDQFTCAHCGETFDKAWSDEESWDEARELWAPEELASGTDVICDDCFQMMQKTLPARLWRFMQQFAD